MLLGRSDGRDMNHWEHGHLFGGTVKCLCSSKMATWTATVKREQAGSFCETLASYPNDLCFNMFTLRQLFICTVLRDVARSCTYHFTTKFGDPWLLAQHIPTSSTSLSLLSLLLLLLPPLVLLLLLSWACCKGAAAPAH